MKFTPLALIALLFSVLLPASFAHAQTYAEVYAVGSDGSTTLQPDFSINQQPWIYVKIFNAPPAGLLNTELTFSFWINPSNQDASNISVPAPSSNQLWITPSNWNSIKQVGTWHTDEFSFNTTGNPAGSFSEAASFKVNAAPEPPATILFLIGALIMGFNILRRRKALATVKI